MDIATHIAIGRALLRKLLRSHRGAQVSEPARDHTAPTQSVTYQDAATETECSNQPMSIEECLPNHESVDLQPDPYQGSVTQDDEEVDEQALRDERYVAFDEVAEEDFTAGPARFIVASDGVKECAALLSTSELTQKICTAIEARRNYEVEEQKAIDAQTALMNHESDIECEISSHECRIGQHVDNSDGHEVIEPLQKALDNLYLMLEDVKSRREAIEAQMLTQMTVLRNCQTSALQILEEAFMASSLCDPPIQDSDTVSQHALDLQDEYQAFCDRQQEGEGEPHDFVPLEVTPDDYFDGNNDHLTAEELAEYETKDEYFAARERLIEAEMRFDHREIDREIDRQATDQSAEEFDVRWVQQFRDLTSQLINAEEAFKAARMAANEDGVDIACDDQCSMFVDRDDDGYRESHDATCTSSVPQDKIMQWLESIPGQADPDEACVNIEVDDWDAREVDMSDSISCVAMGSHRAKIDRWQQDASA